MPRTDRPGPGAQRRHRDGGAGEQAVKNAPRRTSVMSPTSGFSSSATSDVVSVSARSANARPRRGRRERLRGDVRCPAAQAERRRSPAGRRADPGQDHRDRSAPPGPGPRVTGAHDRCAAAGLPPAAARPAPGVGQPQPGRRCAGPGQGRRARLAGAAPTAAQRGDRARARAPARHRPRVPARVPRRHDHITRGTRARDRRAARARPDPPGAGLA